ncbi:hypothetical protein D8I35_08010 [Corticibacter populi]|uniref:DUF4194 domain-containing protein n=1 Tax=Corticibacter populi TaxID=1550736 RepID=A0A3M6QU24_9BURK|nr:hypothetical protein [Corticibacter populi]RMX06463.1 hypothetical protein D8I35_08010 [Corticibacter populi]RZS31979.1 hypothetical protein EV687_2661 [Corticibacter populi]
MNAPDEAALLVAELLARRWLPRQHPRVKRALVDAELWQGVEARLAQIGLRLVDNIHADHVTTALLRGTEHAVFGETGLGSHSNFDLPRDGVSLLVVLWALIVLPKRERQAAREDEEAQGEMFGEARPMPRAASVSPTISYKALLADFGNQLGKKTRLDGNLKRLENHGFIVRRGDDIAEGPLLDLLLDYDILAPRILDGTLAAVLERARAETAQAETEAVPAPAPASEGQPPQTSTAASEAEPGAAAPQSQER